MSVVVGEQSSCALSAGGVVYCWGQGSAGQLGDGTEKEESLTPVAVAGGHRFRAIAAGADHVCGLDEEGQAFCWGANGAGQLGDGTRTQQDRPVPVADRRSFVAITAGVAHTCALTADGRAYCWGDDGLGQLGAGAIPSSDRPVPVSGDVRFHRIAAGGHHTCALDVNGKAWCWGYNDVGQLGDGRVGGRTNAHGPTPVEPVSGLGTIVDIAANDGQSCALDASGAAWCWGDDRYGQLGDGRVTAPLQANPSPVRVVSESLRFTAISTGSFHACALTGDGRAYCWGRNEPPRLGTAATPERCGVRLRPQRGCATHPVPVDGDSRYRSIAAGSFHTCAVTREGAVECWGENPFGQLGTGDHDNVTAPRRVPLRGTGS